MKKLHQLSSGIKYNIVECTVFVGLTNIDALSLGCNYNAVSSNAEPMGEVSRTVMQKLPADDVCIDLYNCGMEMSQ
jgi:hypothetical protein